MAGSSKGLGRGFDSLIPTTFDSSILIDEADRIQKILIETLKPNPEQPRKHFDETATVSYTHLTLPTNREV